MWTNSSRLQSQVVCSAGPASGPVPRRASGGLSLPGSARYRVTRRNTVALPLWRGGGMAVCCAGAATDRMRRIAWLTGHRENDPRAQARLLAFQQGLEKLGWTLTRNLQIDYRWDMNDAERARAAAADVLRLAPDVILANNSIALAALQQATRTLPIIFVNVIEPVRAHHVARLIDDVQKIAL